MARREWWASGGAAILVAAMHGLFVATVMFGGAARKGLVPPDQVGAGASALGSTAEAPEAMQLVDLRHVDPSTTPLEAVASLGIELPQAALVIASLDPLPPPVLEIDLAEEGESTEAAGETQGHAAMFGRYVGQISARIERAWLRPRSDIGERFSCQTKIEQDRRGYVLSVELRRCNGDAQWQRSLVVAIEHASPLPSPPVPAVFANTLVLDFSASPFEAGVADASAYEPAVRSPTSIELPRDYVATNTNKTLGDVAREGGHIELRIVGKNTTWTVRETSDEVPDQTEMERAGKATPSASQRKEL